MRRDKRDRLFLRMIGILNIGVLIFALRRRPPIKDWILVYLFNAVTNGILDSYLTAHKVLKYPVRLFPKVFETHILFDFFVYPTLTVLYNQMTMKDKCLRAFYKLLYFSIPMLLFELLAEKKSSLIRWKKSWKWYHTFLGLTIKSLITRVFIQLVRAIENKQEGIDQK